VKSGSRRAGLEVVLATRNRNKVREISAFLKKAKITPLFIRDLPEVREDGKDLEDNAVKKALSAANYSGKISLADDSGLEVGVLDGNPGVFSARFAGKGCTYGDNNRKLLKLLENVPESRRKAKFRCVIAIAGPDGRIRIVEGVCMGKISLVAMGKSGFGYDPVFIPDGYRKTFGQMNFKAKNRLSHRFKAIKKAIKVLNK